MAARLRGRDSQVPPRKAADPSTRKFQRHPEVLPRDGYVGVGVSVRCARTSSANEDQNKLFCPPSFILFCSSVSNGPKALGVIIWIGKMNKPKASGRFEIVAQNKINLGGQNDLFWSMSALD